jgi:hypothetical protein
MRNGIKKRNGRNIGKKIKGKKPFESALCFFNKVVFTGIKIIPLLHTSLIAPYITSPFFNTSFIGFPIC